MAEEKLTHEEADRRLLEAMNPKKTPQQSSTGLLNKLKELAGQKTGATSTGQKVT